MPLCHSVLAARMDFLWPQSLWLLLLLPGSVAAYRLVLCRRLSAAAQHPLLTIAPRSVGRHLPPALFAMAIALLLVATARPTAMMVMPTEARTVILAIDVSGSMQADDVAPSRLAAAQTAAADFVRSVPPAVRIGVVAFSDDARLVHAPAASREEVLAAIGSLQPLHGTAIGSGILASLDAILPGTPAAIILLTDGQNSAGPDPVDAALLAAAEGVRVYTVGVGTPWGQIRDGLGWRTSVGFDEDALKALAEQTGADYFHASSAADLEDVYARLGSSVGLERIQTEVTALLCAAATILALVSATVSLVWFGRVL